MASQITVTAGVIPEDLPAPGPFPPGCLHLPHKPQQVLTVL